MRRVVNFGALNLDFVYSVDKIVEPGETISSKGRNVFCGGKGLNQSVAIAKAGGDVYHAGICGKLDGEMLVNALNSSGAKTLYLKMNDEPSGHAIIQVDSKGQNSILLFGGANMSFTSEYVDSVLKDFGSEDILLIQNEINHLPYIMKKAKERNMTIVFNPSPITEKILEYPLNLVDIFVLNEIEGRLLAGENSAEDICSALLKKFPGSQIVLTLGKDGCIYCSEGIRLQQETFDIKVVDTTAAGDTFTGYYLASVISGNSQNEAIKYACAAASLSVSKAGAFDSIPDKKDVELFIKEY